MMHNFLVPHWRAPCWHWPQWVCQQQKCCVGWDQDSSLLISSFYSLISQIFMNDLFDKHHIRCDRGEFDQQLQLSVEKHWADNSLTTTKPRPLPLCGTPSCIYIPPSNVSSNTAALELSLTHPWGMRTSSEGWHVIVGKLGGASLPIVRRCPNSPSWFKSNSTNRGISHVVHLKKALSSLSSMPKRSLLHTGLLWISQE